MNKLGVNDVAKLALFAVMFVTTAVLVGMNKLSPDVLKTFLLLVAPSPVFAFDKKEEEKKE
jgi:hypothetical protein